MSNQLLSTDFEKDIQELNKIPAIANILEVICSTTGMGFATVARVTEDRWVACVVNDKIKFGLTAGGELKLETTLCQDVFQLNKTIAIDHVDEDPIYYNHHTPKLYGLQSYISIPIFLSNGNFFGTLCAIDPKPALVNNEKTINMFKLFGELISFHLDSLKSLSETQVKLLEEQKNSEIREQFIAILGHDLRNPVSAISNAAQLLLRSPLDERNTKLAMVIRNSTTRAMGLIENILDFARGKLGEGIQLNYNNSESLESALNQVVTELRIAYPETEIVTDFKLENEVAADYRRIAQLFSNLLGNAITHGEKTTPVKVTAKTGLDIFELCVINKGKKITEETQKHLFKPFSRGKIHQGQEGLGLGLYIANEIADSHGGAILVASSDEETCFTFRFKPQVTTSNI
jgi:signal transduction histidine kinase